MVEENTIPVWTGCFAPYQLVTFNGEEWSPSIEEINHGSYDRTKLFRSSLCIDVGIAPLSLIVLFDGTLVLPACASISKSRALKIFNNHLTSLLLGGMLVEEVAPDDIAIGSINFWGYHRHHVPTGRFTKLSQSLRVARGGPDEAIALYRPKIISEDHYVQVHAAGLKLLKILPENIKLVLLSALTSFTQEKWERSLILGWTSIELMIEKMWKEKILSAPGISGVSQGRRRDFLSDNRTWSSSTRIELLWQRGEISDKIYSLVDMARSARNSFIHTASECTPEAARSAMEAVLNLIASAAENAQLAFDAPGLMAELDSATFHFRPPHTDDTGRLLSEPILWRYPDPAPGFKDWGDLPFEKIPAIQLKPINDKE